MNVEGFLQELMAIAPSAGGGHYGFKKPDGHTRGFVQLIPSQTGVQIHRIWACEPRSGDGSLMMRALCGLADQHRVEIKLKVIPIGRKPFPMSREQLKDWYATFGFAGERWVMIRKPAAKQLDPAASEDSHSAA
jgi:hypothetical protein